MVNYVEQILNKHNIAADTVLKKAIRGLPGLTAKQLVTSILRTNSLEQASKELGYTTDPIKRSVREVFGSKFPDRSGFFNRGGRSPWKHTLLLDIGYRECPKCSKILGIEYFYTNASKANNLSSYCGTCNVSDSKKHKYYIQERTPAWSDLDAIALFYTNCPIGYEVDHIVPLRGKEVSGLHVLNNLQYLTIEQNRNKSNKHMEV